MCIWVTTWKSDCNKNAEQKYLLLLSILAPTMKAVNYKTLYTYSFLLLFWPENPHSATTWNALTPSRLPSHHVQGIKLSILEIYFILFPSGLLQMTSLALTIFSRTNCSTWNFQLSQSLDSFSVYQPQITLHPCFSGSKQPISWFSFPSSLDSKAPNINPSLPAPSFYWTPPLSPSLQPNPETCFLCSCTWTAKMGWGRGEREKKWQIGSGPQNHFCCP